MLPPTSFRRPTRPPLLPLVVLFSVVTAGAAAAQTVFVTHASSGTPVELMFNSDRVQTATADADGTATLAFSLPAGRTEADVRISTERCGDTVRVWLVERGLPAPPPVGACDRRDVSGFFIVRNVTTFVIDVANPDPVVHLRQGPVPPSWLGLAPGPSEGLNLPPAPSGPIVFAGAGLFSSTNASTIACGDASQCTPGDRTAAVAVGAGYWISHIIGFEVSYVRPGTATDLGTGDGFHFASRRKADLVTITAMAGVPFGGFRIYGRGGANYHRATLSTSETIDISGTQNFELKTAGWGWVAAGGLEVWVKRPVAFYVDGGFAKLKGAALGGAEGSLDDQIIFVLAGARLTLPR